MSALVILGICFSTSIIFLIVKMICDKVDDHFETSSTESKNERIKLKAKLILRNQLSEEIKDDLSNIDIQNRNRIAKELGVKL